MSDNKCPFKKLVEPRGPKGLPMVKSLPFFLLNILGFLTDIRKKYGDVSKFNLMGMTTYLVSHPDDIAQIFKEEKKGVYQKSWFNKVLQPFFGDGLGSCKKEMWEVQRKQLQPLFNKATISKWFPLVVEETLDYCESIDTAHEFNIEDFVRPVMQNITSRILFGLKGDNEDSKDIIKAIEELSEGLASHGLKTFIFNGILNKLPTPGNLKNKKSLKVINRIIDKISKSEDEKDAEALLPIFSQFMSPKELRDQLVTFYFGGQDTTNSTLLWIFYYLAKYPEHQKRARNEVLNKLSTERVLEFDDLDELVFLSAVINESMRLAPAAYMMLRDIDKDVQLGQYQLNKDSLIMLSIQGTHRHPDFWDNPSEFIPERFLERKNKGYAFFPYGGGQRMCIGMHLAQMELTTIVGLFIAKFKFELKPGIHIDPKTALTLQPNKSVQINFDVDL